MSPPSDAPSAQAALASEPRHRLLELLRSGNAPQDAHELAATTGLHVTTVRFHLDVLRRAGLVSGRSQPRATAGRPRIVYSPVSHAAPAGHTTLTRLLAGNLANTPAARAARAERVGLVWAAELTADTDRHREVGEEEAARAATALFAEMGFDPELTGDHTDRQLRLRACPFRDAARTNPEVVCSIHLGLLRGVLAAWGAPPTVTRLLPFVEPELCVAHLLPSG